jgi:hypothetical protein
VYYDVGGIASYNGIVYQALLANVNVPPVPVNPSWQVLPAPAGAGVSSLETLTGAITLSCSSGTYTNVGNDIGLTIAFPAAPLTAINGLTGAPVIDTLARSTIEVQTISPNIQVGLNTTAFGTYTEATGGSSLTTITSAACVPSSIIQLTYIHASSVLTPNYLIGLTAGTGSFLVKTNANVDIGDQINWLVLNP